MLYCKWCYGKGCLSCEAKRLRQEEEYKKQFPDGPKPLLVARFDNPDEMQALKDLTETMIGKGAFAELADGLDQYKFRRLPRPILRIFEPQPVVGDFL